MFQTVKSFTFTPALLAACLLGAALLFVAPRGAAASSLYEELGGEQGIDALASIYVARLATDEATRATFAGSNLKRVEHYLALQLCDLAGGPCQYDGDSMHVVHANLGISEAQFHIAVDMLRTLLRERGVSQGARNRLLKLLAPMKRDVVNVSVRGPVTTQPKSNSGTAP
jgi:hemoglobin